MNSTIKKIRTVKVNDRGQLVIPEDFREDLGIEKGATLVIAEEANGLFLRKENDVIQLIKESKNFWKALALESMKAAWEEEDELWDKFAKKNAGA